MNLVDKYFPPCDECSYGGKCRAHKKMFNSVLERLEAGDTIADVAYDFKVPINAIRAIKDYADNRLDQQNETDFSSQARC